MRSTLRLISIAGLSLASIAAEPATQPATTQPATTQPNDPAVLRAAERASAEMRTLNLPLARSAPLADALRFKIVNQQLDIESAVPATAGLCHIEFPELGGVTTINVQNAPNPNNIPIQPLFFQLMHYDFSRNDAIQIITTVFEGPGNLQVSQDCDLIYDELSVQLIQQPLPVDSVPVEGEGPVRLYVKLTNKETSEVRVDLRLTAASFVELRRKYPRETVQYLQPIFRDLKQEAAAIPVDSRAAWQVLADRAPAASPQSAATIDRLIAKLDAESYQDRQAAQDELQKLGQPAVMILLAKNRSALSIQQNTEIDAFLAPYLPLEKTQAAELKNAPNFLLDTLYSDDATLRAAALTRLAELSKEKFEFDVTASPEKRAAAIEKLRPIFMPGLTTQPSQ